MNIFIPLWVCYHLLLNFSTLLYNNTIKSEPIMTLQDVAMHQYASTKFTDTGSEPAFDEVMVEKTITLYLNGNRLTSIVTTPGFGKELAVGFLITEGLIRSLKDLEEIREMDDRVELRAGIAQDSELEYELRSSGGLGLRRSICDAEVFVPAAQNFSIGVLLASLKYLDDETQKKTGGAHTATLVGADGTLRYKAVDIGRHNAVDKVVGQAVLHGDDLSRMFLISSGRQPAGMVMKAARAGIPLIISKAAPISSGIDCARQTNVTLCCYATREKTKAFSSPDRIIIGSP